MSGIESLSEYRSVWLFVLFDLPVDNKEARRRYRQFRDFLLKEGFSQLQFSVYARFHGSFGKAEATSKRIRQMIPPDGRVRLLIVTDRQFGKMEVFYGKKYVPTEEPPPQLMLF